MASVRSLSFSFCPVLIVAGVAPGPFACGDCPEDIGATILARRSCRGYLARYDDVISIHTPLVTLGFRYFVHPTPYDGNRGGQKG